MRAKSQVPLASREQWSVAANDRLSEMLYRVVIRRCSISIRRFISIWSNRIYPVLCGVSVTDEVIQTGWEGLKKKCCRIHRVNCLCKVKKLTFSVEQRSVMFVFKREDHKTKKVIPVSAPR